MTDRHPHLRASAARPRLVALLGCVLTAVALAACGGSSSSHTTTSGPQPGFDPNRPGPMATYTPAQSELIGAGVDPAPKLDLLKRLGVRDIHIGIPWSTIAPDPQSRRRPAFDASSPAGYPAANWAPFDTLVRDIAARHLQLTLALIPPAPVWATGTGNHDRGQQGFWEPSAAAFAQFVRAVGTRYSGHYRPAGGAAELPKVSHWSVWNEPDQGFQLAPQTNPTTHAEQSPATYRALVDAAWTGLHATGHRGDVILIGELAPLGRSLPINPGNFGSMAPLRFLRSLYCVGTDDKPLTGTAATERGCPATAAASAHFAGDHPGLFQASGFANHPYPQGLAPNAVTPDETEATELASTGRLESTLDRLNRVYGSHTEYKIYSTEFGYQTNPPDTESGVVSPTTAAAWMNWAEYLTWQDPRQVSFDQYLITDPQAGNFATGLLSAAGTPKPAYFAYRMPLYLPVTSASRGQALVVWGCVRPAYYATQQTHHAQRVQVQFAATGSTHFKTVSTVTIASPHGFFEARATFPASGSVRLAWRYPDGTEIFSRTVAVTLR